MRYNSETREVTMHAGQAAAINALVSELIIALSKDLPALAGAIEIAVCPLYCMGTEEEAIQQMRQCADSEETKLMMKDLRDELQSVVEEYEEWLSDVCDEAERRGNAQ
jgi:hypothetical protein